MGSRTNSKPVATSAATVTATVTAPVLSELRDLIEQARGQVSSAVNSALTLLYWQVGERINREVLANGRANYGEEIVSTLSTQLVRDYGQGFGLRSLRRMVQFAQVFPDQVIVVSLIRQLSWSHFIAATVIESDTHGN